MGEITLSVVKAYHIAVLRQWGTGRTLSMKQKENPETEPYKYAQFLTNYQKQFSGGKRAFSINDAGAMGHGSNIFHECPPLVIYHHSSSS